ncbi:T9SS type A sorting domain-containing protein [Tamlana flava]|uniref:T9SS type A sorting domain-containing protein n=1 Tax=Tamlana flava TaxID=3158572 RepID=UPI00351B3D6C
MKNFTLFFVGFFCIMAFIFAQNVEVKTYFEDQHIGGLADDGENIWVGVDNLVVEMDKTSWATLASYSIPLSSFDPNPDRYARSVLLNSNGLAWVLCANPLPYLEKFNGDDSWTEVAIPGFLTGLAIDKDDKLWLATHNNLYQYDGTDLVSYDWTNTDMPSTSFSAIAVDNQNNKWLGLTSGLVLPRWAPPMYLVKFDGMQFTKFTSSYLDGSDGAILSISVCPSGKIWMGTYGNGLISFNGANWNNYSSSNSEIPPDSVWNVTVEGANIIWMSTQNGLTRFDGVNWETYNTDNSTLPSNTINSILVDENGTKWVGTDKGLISFKGNALSSSDKKFSKVQFKLFPNPANDFLTLEISPDAISSTIEVFNVQGKLIKSMKMTNNSYILDISTISSGMYFIQLKTTNGMSIKKFVKQN